ncbi:MULTISPECIES: hypothetical protein [Methanobacterium]|uniref:Uncharacterized protein n=1 Tax=Methanobacterium veterum TaxID=408577 RepID=A0A9E5DR16_9EURY|nr:MULTISPECIES: hypothetical protein [Methanobacterium]MCZ3366667.1 hypothetical protein [Methanobacterium veterum]MCZ3374188.1 hypothetical protein [Methanobacterium veterum]
MESFLPLTVLGAIIGIYTILPNYKKLRVGYSLGKLDLFMLSLLALVMLSLLIFSSYLQNNTINSVITLNQLINQPISTNNILINNLIREPFNYTFLVDLINITSVIFIFLIFFVKFFTKKIRINNKKYFIDKLDELFYKGEYNTVFSLIDDNYKNVMEFKKKIKYSKRTKEIRRLLEQMENREAQINNDKENNIPFYDNLKSRFGYLWEKSTYEDIYEYLEDKISIIYKIKYFKGDNNLQENIKSRLLDYDYIEKVVKYNPYFGLNIVIDEHLDSSFREDYANLYFRELMKDRNSILYREIRNTTSGYERYEISKNNKIMHQVLYNINKADEANVYKPIGDLTDELLDKQHKKPYDEYNDYNSKLIDDPERLNDPLFMAVHFFDIMIRESIYQDVKWHMWLYYYDSFVEKIVRNYEISDLRTVNYEFPNVYSFLLNEILGNLISWIRLVKNDNIVPQKLRSTDCKDYENENIIKSSIICLCYCIQYILKPNKIPRKFKVYLLENVFHLYFDLVLCRDKIVNEYSTVLENCLLKTASVSTDHRDILLDSINEIDKPSLIYKHKVSGLDTINEIKNKLINAKLD